MLFDVSLRDSEELFFIYAPVALIRLNYLIDTVDDKDSPSQFTQSKPINVVFDRRQFSVSFSSLERSRNVFLSKSLTFFMVHTRRHRQKIFVFAKVFQKIIREVDRQNFLFYVSSREKKGV